MAQKIIILITITITLFLIISSSKYDDKKGNESNSFNNTKNEKKDNSSNSENEGVYLDNPYLILQVAPWTKFEVIKKEYAKIKSKYIAQEKTNTKKFKKIKRAFEFLEKEYEKNNHEDKTFFSVLIGAFKTLLFYEGIMLLLLLITWFIYKFNTYAGVLVGTFVAIDNIIPHWFDTMLTQYIVSLILGTIIYFNKYFFPFLRKKKDEDNDDDNDTNNNTSNGGVKRRRFEKVEF